ncbi:hypothetical protein TrCOL_g8472 [Triparma columacea]|uniref:protein O-GlcNAc transferase n=1 Tax=Triparma columacea TaxID=722753 RepID=A0A9W7G3P7_9STRA|nr:hypothetical protein TrCOL_g8472 [Triparma columacea]
MLYVDEASGTIPASPDISNLWNTKGVVYKGMGELGMALRSFGTSIVLDEGQTNYNVYYNVGNIFHYNLVDLIELGGGRGADEERVFRDLLEEANKGGRVVASSEQALEEAAKNYQKADDVITRLLSAGERSVLETIDYVNFLNDFAIGMKKLDDDAAVAKLLAKAVEYGPGNLMARGNLVVALHKMNMLEAAKHHSLKAIEISPTNANVRHNYGLVLQKLEDIEEAKSQWLRAIELDPSLSNSIASLGHLEGNKGNLTGAKYWYEKALDLAKSASNYDEVASIRLQLATAVIPTIYSSNEHIRTARSNYVENLKGILALQPESQNFLNDPMTTTGSGSLGYYIIYQGFDDIELRRLLANVYWKFAPSLRYVAPFLANERSPVEEKQLRLRQQRKIRIGFHSAFFFRHSVGLLMEGVIMNIDRSKFHVTVFFQNYEEAMVDEVFQRIMSSADAIYKLPSVISVSRNIIASQELDILVFGEAGMDSVSYFLPFSRLAKRTALFWGHALTSGIANRDGIEYGKVKNAREVGGIDYFVSSKLFERETSGPPQHRYAETLYLMDGMTTYFTTPLKAREGMTRESFGLPPDKNIYLCPQTLYKLHPDFDILIVAILRKDPNAAVVFPVAQKTEWTEELMKRMVTNLRSSEEGQDLVNRILFVRRTDFDEFIALASLANVILDPFPVGGGRSSLEIFSTGSPIVMAYHKTNILQLNYAMYKSMDVMDLVCYTDEDYVDAAVRVGSNRQVEAELRKKILERVSVLYENKGVIAEWEKFFEYALDNERPASNAYFDKVYSDKVVVAVEFEDDEMEAGEWGVELENGATLAYAIKLNFEDKLLDVKIAEGEDPLGYAREISDAIGAEWVKERWIAAVLQHGIRRLEEDVVFEFEVSGRGGGEVRAGDDLGLVSNYYGLKMGLNWRGIERLHRTLKVKLGGRDETRDWLNIRRLQDAMVKNSGGRPSIPPPSPVSRETCHLTVALTTCKRLDLFKRTIESWGLAAGGLGGLSGGLCEIIVVDDSSSDADRTEMQRLYPNFRFVWKKGEEDRGHARSMNLIKDVVQTRYLLYLEDDWEYIGERPVGEVLAEAIEVLVGGEGEVAQVLLNDQSSRDCAEGSVKECEEGTWKRQAGWKRKTDKGVEYLEHEFGVLDPRHEFSYWPGFSLNPGVWDLERMRGGAFNFEFDPEDKRMEQTFSMRCYDEGMLFAHIGQVVVRHSGDLVSSYVLNGEDRPFDTKLL